MKSNKLLISVLALGFAASGLMACSGGSSTTERADLDPATAFTFDFNTGAYSFTGGKAIKANTQFYMIRIYAASNEQNVLATSDRIDVTSANTYSGTMEITLDPGEYNAVCTRYATGGYNSGKTTVSGKATALLKPTVTAYWEENGPDVGVKINVSASNPTGTTYTVTMKKDDATIWSDAAFAGGEKTIMASECVTGTTLSKDDNVTVEAFANASGEYTQSQAASTKASEQQQGGPSGGPSGDGGGGGGASITVPSSITIDTTLDTWDITVGSSSYLEWTAAKDSPARDGCDYSYTFTNHDSGWPFTWDAYLELKTGGTAHLYMAAGGPLSEADQTGTWTLAGTTATVTF